MTLVSDASRTSKPVAPSFIQVLVARFSERIAWMLYVFVNGFVAIAVLATIAMLSKAPFIFPSLGASAILMFYSPPLPTASPRSVVLGHAIGILCGYAALLVTGLQNSPSVMVMGVDNARIVAAAFSLALTGALMVFFRVTHPPAGATALVISLGVFTKPYQFPIMEFAVIILTLHAIVANKLAGVDYPVWTPRTPPLHS